MFYNNGGTICEVLVRLDMRSDTPIYLQIAEGVAARIREGSFSSGDRLPPARELATALAVNSHTVLKAYSVLEQDGLVEMRRGRGGVVVHAGHDIGALVRSLVRQARGAGMTRQDVVEMVGESW